MAMKKDLPTVAQLAQAAGVSPATVSRVLNHKGIVKADTYNRVVAVLQAKGYPFVEKAGRADPSDVLMISLPSLDNPFYADIVRGAKSGATRHGYHLIINESHINHNTLPGILELVHSLRISGLITVNHISSDILHTLSNVVPLVQCCEYDESTDLPYVSVDDFAASKKATDHLLSQGCRRIAFLSGPSRYKYARWRLRGYEEALRAAGIAPGPEPGGAVPGGKLRACHCQHHAAAAHSRAAGRLCHHLGRICRRRDTRRAAGGPARAAGCNGDRL